MKKGLLAVAVLIALGVVAQRGKETVTESKGAVKTTEEVANKPKPRTTGGQKDVKSIDEVEAKGGTKSNNGYSAVKAEGGMSGKEFGQQRAEEARAKYSDPASEKEAKEMVSEIKTSVKNQVDVIDTKIASATELVEQKHDLGGMTDLEYELAMAKIDAFKVRQQAINAKLK